MGSLESWTIKEVANFKDCVTLTGWNADLVALSVPTRSIQEVCYLIFKKETINIYDK